MTITDAADKVGITGDKKFICLWKRGIRVHERPPLRGNDNPSLNDENSLRELVSKDPDNLTKVANRIGITYELLLSWMSFHGIPVPTKLDKSRFSFMKRVEKQPNGCWIWLGRDLVKVEGVRSPPRSASAKLFRNDYTGSVTKPMCGNENCVNPNHLVFIGMKLNDGTVITRLKQIPENWRTIQQMENLDECKRAAEKLDGGATGSLEQYLADEDDFVF